MTSKAEELWEKYAIDEMIDRAPFLAALREYGAEVRKKDAEIARELHTGEQDDITRDAKHKSAAAIEREELP